MTLDVPPVDTASVDWDIYYMNGGMSYLQGAGSLDNSLLSLNHAPANQFFGFQVGGRCERPQLQLRSRWLV